MINTLLMAIAGACLYRHRGAAYKYKKYFPRPFNQIAFALPYAYCVPMLWGYWSFGVALIVLVSTTLAVLSGHGNFFNNDVDPRSREPETTEFLIRWALPYIPMRLYKFIGMCITGLAITVPCGIATGSALIAFSGVLKGVAYYVVKDTEKSEWLTRALLWGSLALLTGGAV